MYRIMTEYRGQGEDVVGAEFDTLEEAEAHLTGHGWKRDTYNVGLWCKDGPTRMMGCLGVSVAQYVFIGEDVTEAFKGE